MLRIYYYGCYQMSESQHKETYIRNSLDGLFRVWLGKVTFWGAALFLVLGGIDYISAPEHFTTFFYYRLVIATALLAISFSATTMADKGSAWFYNTMALVAVAGSAATLELMVLSHGGHESLYFSGHILLGICVLGFIPARMPFNVAVTAIIFGTYTVPILMLNNIENMRPFYTSSSFMAVTFAAMLVMRSVMDRATMNELAMRFEIDEHRAQLSYLVENRSALLSESIEALKRSEEKYHRLFTQMLNGFAYHEMVLDEKGRPVDFIFLEVNDAFERQTGLMSRNIVGKKASEVLEDFDSKEGRTLMETYGKVAMSGEQAIFDRYFPSFDKWLAVTAYSPGRNYFVTITEDITERKWAMEELSASKTKLSGFMDSATDGFILFDKALNAVEINEAALRILKKKRDMVIGTHIIDMVPNFRLHNIYNRFLNCLLTGTPVQLDDFNMSGQTYLMIKAFKVGEGIGLIVDDITARKRIEGQLAQDRQDWVDTFNTITDIITLHDNELNIVRSNRAAEVVIGKHGLLALHTKHSPGECAYGGCPLCKGLLSGEPEAAEIFEPTLGNDVEIQFIPRIGQEGSATGYLQVVRDISHRKQAEKQIKAQFERIEALHTVEMAISSSLDLNLTLNIVIDQVLTKLRADAADVLLLNQHTLTLDYGSASGFNANRIKKTRLRLGEGIAGRIAQDRELLCLTDINERDGGPAWRQMVDEERFKCYVGIPLMAKGNMLGVVEVFHRTPFVPDREWLSFLEDLSRQAAIAIDNASLFNQLKASHDNLALAYETTIEGWARALDLRDKETEGHSRRVTELALEIARNMDVSDEELVHIQRGALLHDIGKIGVPDSILLKDAVLSRKEREIMEMHPLIAYRLLSGIPFLRKALDIPYCHHERWDGKGYPRSLKGTEIPLPARIFSVVDQWDAMTSDRPYRKALPIDEVRTYIQSHSGTFFDPRVVDIFLNLPIFDKQVPA